MPIDGCAGWFVKFSVFRPLEGLFVVFTFKLISFVEMGFAVVVVTVAAADDDVGNVVVAVVVVVADVVANNWFDEAFSPSSNFSKVSRGTLHPHPFKSEYWVKRQVMSRPYSSALNGLRKESGLTLFWNAIFSQLLIS